MALVKGSDSDTRECTTGLTGRMKKEEEDWVKVNDTRFDASKPSEGNSKCFLCCKTEEFETEPPRPMQYCGNGCCATRVHLYCVKEYFETNPEGQGREIVKKFCRFCGNTIRLEKKKISALIAAANGEVGAGVGKGEHEGDEREEEEEEEGKKKKESKRAPTIVELGSNWIGWMIRGLLLFVEYYLVRGFFYKAVVLGLLHREQLQKDGIGFFYKTVFTQHWSYSDQTKDYKFYDLGAHHLINVLAGFFLCEVFFVRMIWPVLRYLWNSFSWMSKNSPWRKQGHSRGRPNAGVWRPWGAGRFLNKAKRS